MLLGEVRQLEVQRERAHQPALLVDRQGRDDRLDGLEVAGARGLPHAFLGVVERLPFLFPDDVPEQRAEEADVAAKGALRIGSRRERHGHLPILGRAARPPVLFLSPMSRRRAGLPRRQRAATEESA